MEENNSMQNDSEYQNKFDFSENIADFSHESSIKFFRVINDVLHHETFYQNHNRDDVTSPRLILNEFLFLEK